MGFLSNKIWVRIFLGHPDFQVFCKNFHRFCSGFHGFCPDFWHFKPFGGGLVPPPSPPPTPLSWQINCKRVSNNRFLMLLEINQRLELKVSFEILLIFLFQLSPLTCNLLDNFFKHGDIAHSSKAYFVKHILILKHKFFKGWKLLNNSPQPLDHFF